MIEWNRRNGQYTALNLGKWRVGSVYLDSMRSKDDPLVYAATCRLPGIKDDLGRYATELEAKQRVEGAVAHWLRGSGIVEPGIKALEAQMEVKHGA